MRPGIHIIRFIACLLTLAGAVFGSSFAPCNCPPSIGVFVNGLNYSNSFQIVTVVPGQSYAINTIGGSITDSTPDTAGGTGPSPFSLSVTATTLTDPDEGFGLDVSGDPTVAIFITQTYVGTFPILKTDSFGQLIDLDGNGQASVSGAPTYIQTTKISGSVVNQINTGCASTLCPASTETFTPVPAGVQNSPPFPNVLELDIQFTLSAGDEYILRGSSIVEAPVPEPATGRPLMAVFLLAMAWFGWRRNRNRGSLA